MFASSYFARSLFAGAFFGIVTLSGGGAGVGATSSYFPSSYFARSYFPGAYFPNVFAASVVGDVVPTYVFEVELQGEGLGWTDLGSNGSGDVLVAGVTIRHGIDGTGPTDLVATTSLATFALRNDVGNSAGLIGYYSLYHANKRAGWELGINCRIRIIDPATQIAHERFYGRIDSIDPAPGVFGPRRVDVTAVGWMDEAARWVLVPEIGQQVGKRWDEILGAILAQMPRQPPAVDFDPGVETYAYALDTSSASGQSALTEFAKLAASEFGPIYQKADGTLRAESRHGRLLHTGVDWTITEADMVGLTMPASRDEVLNAVRVTVHPKIVDPAPTTIVYSQVNVIEVGVAANKFLLGPFRDPITGDPIGATDIQPLVAGSDYIANSEPDSTGQDLTSLFTIVVTAGPSGARFEVTSASGTIGFLTTLQLRGRGIYDHGTVQAEAINAASVASIGQHVVVIDMPYQDDDDVAAGAAQYVLAKYGTAFALAHTVSVIGDSSAKLTQILQRDISDRLALSETMTGLNSDFFINAIELVVLPTQHLSVTYTLAPAADPLADLYWILGTGVLGTSTIPAPF